MNEDKKVTPVQQKKRRMAPDRIAAASKEVEELKRAGILKETRYQTWVANTVMVKKEDGAWRTCVDFTDINKACTKIGVYCYRKMPFGLKNAGAIYQRLVDKVFESQIGRNLEAYVDDMVIKSMDKTYMMANIQETFERLRKINMKLNPKKCSFGMEEGQFLGHVVSKQGIKANSAKIQALTSLKRPKTIKEVQSLNEKLAALNRFLSKSAEKSLPFFKTLKGCLEKKDFTWTREADKAFEEMKRYIEKLPTLGRVARWAIELGEHEIEFKPRNAIKAQILADFLAKTKKEDEETDFQEQQPRGQNTRWKLYKYGASSGDGSGAGLMIVNPEGTEFTYALKFKFTTTNNEAEYEAVIAGLHIVKEMKIKEITVFVDSQLVAN
ncbi:reverse transcriptase domain-containing protein [Tanacetum coccineum]